MKAVTFCFWNLEPNLCLYRSVFAFLPFIVDLTFGKILNINTLKLQSLLIDLRVLIGPYSKFYYPAWLECYN